MKKSKTIQISVPKPCSEDWNQMTPQEQGRFCDSCQKCVVDFTKYSDEQLLNFFTQKNAKNICGRFREDQLDRKIFVPPTSRKYYQWFISLGFIIFLTNLLGIEAKAQEPVKKEWRADQKSNKSKGSIQGTIVDENGAPVINATIQVLKGGIIKSGNVTNLDGNYVIKPLSPGRYEVSVEYTGYGEHLVKDIIVTPDKPAVVDVTIQPKSTTLKEVVIISKQESAIITTGFAFKTDEPVEAMPVRKLNCETDTNRQQDNDHALYILDGVKIQGSRGINIIQDGYEVMHPPNSGLPANYSSHEELKQNIGEKE